MLIASGHSQSRSPVANEAPVPAHEHADVSHAMVQHVDTVERGGAKLKDVAKLAGVHQGTASRALDPAKSFLVQRETRARVEAAALRLGYRPDIVARSLRSGTTKMIGVVVANLGNPFAGDLIHGIASFLYPRGFMPLVVETLDDRERLTQALDGLLGRRVDAVILAAARSSDADIIGESIRVGLRIVNAVRALPGSGIPTVAHDDSEGARLVVEHLSGLGHQRLGELRAAPDAQPFGERSSSFARRAAELEATVVKVPEHAAHPTAEEGFRLTELYLRSVDDLPTALFAHNDAMAIGAIEALRRAGLRCPADVSIVGYNDAPLSDHIEPALTTVRYPSFQVGRRAAEVALAHLDDPARPCEIVSFPAELIIRESTAPPPVRSRP